MKCFNSKAVVLVLAAASTAAASAEWLDRPGGVRIGERMTLRPYVSASASYDSNAHGQRNGSSDVIWNVNAGLGLEYKAESWNVKADAFYQYHAYTRNKDQRSGSNNYHSFGENIHYSWTDALPGEKGWALMFSQRFQQVNQTEDMVDGNGYEYNRNRREFKFAIAGQRRFAANWHTDVNASYYWLDYQNSNAKSGSFGLYGWERATVGAEIGYAPSKWTDILIAGSYQNYDQKDRRAYDRLYSSDSWGKQGRPSAGAQGLTVQGGIGSYATEKITYRALAGWSQYRYDSNGKTSNGFTYTFTGNYTISDTWKTMAMATSYYQPTEREYGSSSRVDSLSWGLAHTMIHNKLHGTFDIAFRRTAREYSATKANDYDLDSLSFRFGLLYDLNRYLHTYANFEYRNQWCEEGKSARGREYDYDRFRLTVGLRLSY